MQEFLPKKNIRCHDTGFEKTCFECVTQFECQKWVSLKGQDPQSGEHIEVWGCSDKFQLTGMLELAKMIRQMDGTLQEFRNDTLRIGTADVIRQAEQVIEEARKAGALAAPELKAIANAKG